MEGLMVDVLPMSRSFWEKMQAYSRIRSWASCCIIGSQSAIPNKSIFWNISSGSVSSCWIFPSDKSSWADLHCMFSCSFSSCLLGIYIDGTMLAAVTMPTSVWGSKIISVPDKFQNITATPDPPGINSEVLPETIILVHLGDGSTNTWTCFWCPVTFMSPLAITIWKPGTITFLIITTLPFHLI